MERNENFPMTMKKTNTMMWILIGGHIGFISVGLLACGVWFWGLALLAVSGLMGLRVVRLLVDEIRESVDEMNGVTWHPKSGSGPRGELSFEEEEQEILRQNRKDGPE